MSRRLCVRNCVVVVLPLTYVLLSPTTWEVKWLACSPRVWKIVGSSPDRVEQKTMKLEFVASPLVRQY